MSRHASPYRPRGRRAPLIAVLALAVPLALPMTLAMTLAACSGDADGSREIGAPPPAPESDPVERAADAEVRTLLDPLLLTDVIAKSGLERLTPEQRTALDAWMEEARAMAPTPPPLRYKLDTDRFDAASRTWRVDVKIPSLQAALGAPECRLALVLEPRPGQTGPDAEFTIVEARLALR